MSPAAAGDILTAITSRVGIAHHFAKPIAVVLCGQCPPYNLWLIDVKTAVSRNPYLFRTTKILLKF
jgi:hypothetical protein